MDQDRPISMKYNAKMKMRKRYPMWIQNILYIVVTKVWGWQKVPTTFMFKNIATIFGFGGWVTCSRHFIFYVPLQKKRNVNYTYYVLHFTPPPSPSKTSDVLRRLSHLGSEVS